MMRFASQSSSATRRDERRLQDQARVFEKLAQVGAGEARGGFGLGLGTFPSRVEALGAQAILRKPVSLRCLFATIRRFC
jgi:hypothetical protein